MLQRIEAAEAEIGMFVERLEGNWLRHPFWKRRFVLSDEKQLRVLRESSVPGVIIDTSRGCLPKNCAEDNNSASEREPAKPLASGIFASEPLVAPRGSAPVIPVRIELPGAREFGRAKAVADRSQKVISRVFLNARLGEKIKLADVEAVVEEIYESVASNPHTLTGILRCQAETGEVYRHALASCALMISLGRTLKLSRDDIRLAGLTGLLMDVGVGQMSDHLAEVDGDYRALPQPIMEQHVAYGHDVLSLAGDVPQEVVRACLDHHERVDGSGFPFGIIGDQIGILAKMAAVCDDFDFLVSGGYNRPPLDPAMALEQIQRQQDSYDDTVLAGFSGSVGIYPIGTFVELESGLIAMVVDINQDDPSLPMVRAFHSIRLDKSVKQQTIDLRFTYGTDKIISVIDTAAFDLPPAGMLRKRLLTRAYQE
ncbi:HD-GYP domain-containing protein [Qipengyuania sp.]|uniref:HD-GYP domain-containing protein n=1 Tax=Qipengyuania sp. TaxID=2004515 RepID=UPI0035C79B45